MAATASRQVSSGDPFISLVYLVEGLAQLAGVATVQEEGEGGFLATIDHAEFLEPYQAGDTLIFSVRVKKAFGRLYLMEGDVTVGERVLARATLTLGVGKV